MSKVGHSLNRPRSNPTFRCKSCGVKLVYPGDHSLVSIAVMVATLGVTLVLFLATNSPWVFSLIGLFVLSNLFAPLVRKPVIAPKECQ